MSVIEEMAAQRMRVAKPTRSELIESARWLAKHPDAPKGTQQLCRALLEEIDAAKKRLAVAIRYAAKRRTR